MRSSKRRLCSFKYNGIPLYGHPLNTDTRYYGQESRDGAVVEHSPPTQASHQCGPRSIPGLGVKCGLSLLLVLVLAPRGFSPVTPVFPSPQKPTFSNFNFQGHTSIGVSLCCVFLAIVRCKLNKVSWYRSIHFPYIYPA